MATPPPEDDAGSGADEPPFKMDDLLHSGERGRTL